MLKNLEFCGLESKDFVIHQPQSPMDSRSHNEANPLVWGSAG